MKDTDWSQVGCVTPGMSLNGSQPLCSHWWQESWRTLVPMFNILVVCFYLQKSTRNKNDTFFLLSMTAKHELLTLNFKRPNRTVPLPPPPSVPSNMFSIYFHIIQDWRYFFQICTFWMCYFIAFIFLMNKCVFSLRSCIGWVENPKTSLFLLEIWGYKYFVCADFFKMMFTAFNIESICLRTASFLTPICKVFSLSF